MSSLPTKPYLVFLAGIFCLVIVAATWLVLWANGFRFLTQPIRIVKTGVISLRVRPSDGTTLAVNGKQVPSGRFDLTDLAPGRYSLKLEHPGFSDWETTVQLDGGRALLFHHVVLFYTNPKRLPVTDLNEINDFEKVLDHPERFQAGLQVLDGEIWAEDQLVTRYSEPVKQALWLPGENHILAQVGATVHVLERDGSHDLTLLSLDENAKEIRFAPIAGGQKMILAEEGQLSVIELSTPVSLIPLPTFSSGSK